MNVYSLGDKKPQLPPEGEYWLAPNATLVGDVILKPGACVWFGAVVRGDNDPITIGRDTNIQDGSVLHSDPGEPLTIGDGVTANATAKTVFGALRALETFSQLVRFDFETDGYVVDGAPYHIMDAPRFAHRGLMVDTARHYQPLASLRAIIDSLTNAKLNVLHWHMVDDQSFPFQVK
jgi:hypothetical protein